MSELQFAGDGKEVQIEKKGHISVNDPACGAGAMLIAFANVAKKHGINYQKQVLFIAQDIDRTAAMMCYIQLSLLGCPAIVAVGDIKAICDSLQSRSPIRPTRYGVPCSIT